MSDQSLSSLMCDYSHRDFSLCRLWHSTLESALSSSLSDLMKRFTSARMGPCLFLVCFSRVTCLSLVIWISSHNMLHRVQMSHVQKKSRSRKVGFGTKAGKFMVDKYFGFRREAWSFNWQWSVRRRRKIAWKKYKKWWRGAKIYRSNDVPWRVKCRRMVEHVDSVFCFGNEWVVYSISKKNEKWANYCTKVTTIAKKIWVKMNSLNVWSNRRKNAESNGVGLWWKAKCGD